MKFNKIITIFIITAIFIVMNVLYFMWITEDTRNDVMWILYGFTCLSFVVAAISIFAVSKDGETYKLAIPFLSLRYLAVQSIISIYLIYKFMSLLRMKELSGFESTLLGHYKQIVLTISLILFVYYAVRIAIHFMANKATEKSIQDQVSSHNYISNNYAFLNDLIGDIKDENAKKEINGLMETLRYSPAESLSIKIHADRINNDIQQLKTLSQKDNWEQVAKTAQNIKNLIKSTKL